jgi:hypothetical protein
MIIIEVSALLFGVNYLYSAIEGRKMLFEPYADFIHENSVFVYNVNVMMDISRGLIPNQSKAELMSGLKGSYREIEVLRTTVFASNGDRFELYVCDDDVLLRMNLPLIAGSWIKQADISNSAIASRGMTGNTEVAFEDNTTLNLDVKGVLTAATYRPDMEYFYSEMSCMDFSRSISQADDPFILVGRSAVENTDNFIRSYGSLLIFDEFLEEDKEYLISNAIIISGEKLYENSMYLIYADLQKFYPLIFCVVLVVLIGVISFTCIIFKHSERDNGIFFMCGNIRSGSLKILMGELSIILTLSCFLTAAAFWVFDYLAFFGTVKITLSIGNIIITAVTILILLLSMIIIPYALHRRSTPVEIIRRSL